LRAVWNQRGGYRCGAVAVPLRCHCGAHATMRLAERGVERGETERTGRMGVCVIAALGPLFGRGGVCLGLGYA